jgi:hypothetical protein
LACVNQARNRFDRERKRHGPVPYVLYNLRTDQGETTDVAADNPGVVQEMLKLAESIRIELGEYMQRGQAQRPTGSIYPDCPVISHPKDWGQVPAEIVDALKTVRTKRQPDWNANRRQQ